MKISSQSGNAVLFILIAVALFGALAYTFMRGAKSGQGNLSSNQARIAAQEIINYSTQIERAVDKLRGRGCSESDLSFENDTRAFYTNASTPADGSCKIFNSTGAGNNWVSANSNWMVSTNSAEPLYGDFFITGLPYLYDPANPALQVKDLFIVLPYINKQICVEINRMANVNKAADNAPFINPGHAWTSTPANAYYTGSFAGGVRVLGAGLEAVTMGCMEGTSGTHIPKAGTYHFFKVLLLR